MNKYYTPTIDEFHAGFEYEYYSQGLSEIDIDGIAGWYEAIFSLDIEEGEQKHPTQKVRVKYLDEDDIESLGFSFDETGNNYAITFKNKNNFYIEVKPNNNVRIFTRSSNKFIGIIKNKSELKRLLKQLNISYDE